jgi:hypothetical protein
MPPTSNSLSWSIIMYKFMIKNLNSFEWRHITEWCIYLCLLSILFILKFRPIFVRNSITFMSSYQLLLFKILKYSKSYIRFIDYLYYKILVGQLGTGKSHAIVWVANENHIFCHILKLGQPRPGTLHLIYTNLFYICSSIALKAIRFVSVRLYFNIWCKH